MDLTLFLARIVGLYLLFIGLFYLARRNDLRKMVSEFYQSSALVVMSGCLSIIFGLLIVLNYNVWAWHWTVLPTLVGWILLVRGLIRLFFPSTDKEFAKKSSTDNAMIFSGIVMIVVAFVLVYQGFFERGY